jgi:hypothetical protein
MFSCSIDINLRSIKYVGIHLTHKQNNFESDEMNNFEVKVMRENMCVKLKIKK